MFSRYNPLHLWWKDLHKPTIYCVVALVIFGLLGVFSASYQMAEVLYVSNLYFFKKHIIFVCVAVLAFIFLSFQTVPSMVKLAQLGFVCTIFAMFAIFAMSGKSVKGAQRWLDLTFITIQPSEILKPFFIVISAYIYYLYKKTQNILWILLYAGIFIGIITMLFFQPDFGMMLTYMFLAGVMFCLSRSSAKSWFFLIIFATTMVVVSVIFLPHVRGRVVMFFHGKESYQTKLAKNAIQNGGLFGKGFGSAEVSKRLPDSHNDFIFARIGEEFGIVALLLILALFLIIILSNLEYAYLQINLQSQNIKEEFITKKHHLSFMVNNCVIILTMALLFFEVSVNVAVNLSLIPPKGMALPFVSYGGSSMLAHGIMLGFLSVANRKKYNFANIGESYSMI